MTLFWISITLVFYSYFLYPVLLRFLSITISINRESDEKLRPFVSIIVAAYNEESNIPDKIDNYRRIDYPTDKIEILIGSDGSTDRTNEILQNFSAGNIRSFIYNERSGKAAVLNRLVKKAGGEILVFSDANTVYRSDAILKLVRHFKDKSVGGVCGQLRLINPTSNTGGEGERLYWGYENNLKKYEGKIKTVLGANGAIYALRKELYHPLPENKVIMDDFLIPLRTVMDGYDIIYDEEAQATETTSPHLKGEFARKIRIGAANFNALSEIKSLLNPFRGFVAFALWSHKIFRWFAPFFLLCTFLCNLFLLDSLFYVYTFIFQIFFYASALVGFYLDKKGKAIKIFTYPLYFSAINLAMAIGFFKFLTGSQKPAWSRVERS